MKCRNAALSSPTRWGRVRVPSGPQSPSIKAGVFDFMPFYVYIIQSDADGSYYKGFSLQPLIRLTQHNNKESGYTSNKTPWRLIHLEIFDTKTTALKRERSLKKYSHAQILALSKTYKNRLLEFLINEV